MLGGHKHYTGPRSNLLDNSAPGVYQKKDQDEKAADA
jgi:hypothetical protein